MLCSPRLNATRHLCIEGRVTLPICLTLALILGIRCGEMGVQLGLVIEVVGDHAVYVSERRGGELLNDALWRRGASPRGDNAVDADTRLTDEVFAVAFH